MNQHRKEIAELIETTFRAAEARLREEHNHDLRESQSKARKTQNAAAILPAEVDSYIRHIKALVVARAQAIADSYTTFDESSAEAGEKDLESFYRTVLSSRRGTFEAQAGLLARRTGLSLRQLPGLLRRFGTDSQAALLEGKSILARQSAAFRNTQSASALITGKAVTKPSPITPGRSARLTSDQFDDLLPLLLRRRVFDQDLTKLSSLATSQGRPLSLIMIDIDHFKKVNDAHGHPVGDQVLVETSRLLHARLEDKGLGYRYGGEELAVLLQNYAPEEATTLAEVFRADVEKRVYPKAMHITVSLGVACLPGHATDGVSLLKAADDALLRAKELGRNLVRVSGEPEIRPAETRTLARRKPAPSEEQEILREAAKTGGQILWVTTDQNASFIGVGKKTFPPMDKLNLYESKKARRTLESLAKRGLIEPVSGDTYGGEIYELTVEGFEAIGLDQSAR